MFILRRVTSEFNRLNESIGKEYSTVIKDVDLKFNEILGGDSKDYEEWIDKDEIYGFIIYNSGSEIKPLYKKSSYYVMTENGATFENISHKSYI